MLYVLTNLGLQRSQPPPPTFAPTAQRQRVLGMLMNGEVEMLYAAPEALVGQDLSFLFINTSKTGPECSLLVVDEAHAISKWGMDFRGSYRRIRSMRQRLGNPTTLGE